MNRIKNLAFQAVAVLCAISAVAAIGALARMYWFAFTVQAYTDTEANIIIGIIVTFGVLSMILVDIAERKKKTDSLA